MKKTFGMDDLMRARKLQNEAISLHLIPPPVLWWSAVVTDKHGNTTDEITAKANSYTRNALNLMAVNLTLPLNDVYSATIFDDGVLSFKATSGAITAPAAAASAWSAGLQVVLGKGGEPESLNSYALASEISTGWLLGAVTSTTAFDSLNRKLVTTKTRTFTNNTGSSVDIKEAGVTGTYYKHSTPSSSTNGIYLQIYDVFDAIAVPNGHQITWTYTGEVAFPNA